MHSCRSILVVFVLLVCGAWAASASAQSRVALIVANSDYKTVGWDLAHPARDAELMSEALRKVGFDVALVFDATEDDMEDAFKTFGERIAAGGPETVGFFYYAGHGVQSEGLNYLIPTDLEAYSEADVWGSPRLETLFRHLKRAGNETNFVVLDACRNNPLLSSTRNVAGGLAQVSRSDSRGMMIAYATAPGAVAADDSPFTQALAEALTLPGLSAETLFRRVATRVDEVTEGRQQPWTESGLLGLDDFCFAGCLDTARTPKAPARKAEYKLEGDENAFIGDWSLVARVDGLRYRISDFESVAIDFLAEDDFDQNGTLDLLMAIHNGGNCCPPAYQVALDLGDGHFSVEAFDVYAWEEPVIAWEEGRWVITFKSINEGVNTEAFEEMISRYEIRDAKPVLLSSSVNNEAEALERQALTLQHSS